MSIYAYYRVSTQSQVEQNGIEMQLAEIEKYCKTNNIILAGEFKDEGISGTRFDSFKAVDHEGERRLMIYIGGTWGKKPRMGTPLPRLVAEEEIFPLLEKTLLWFKANAFQKERLGAAIDRIGVDTAIAQILDSDDLLRRKEEILAAPVLTRK